MWLCDLVGDFFFFWNVRPAFEWGHLHDRKHGDDAICNMLTCACKNYLESAPHHNFSFWLSVCHNILGNNASLKRKLHCFHMGSISLSDTILVQKPWRRHSPCHCGAEKTSTSFAAKVGQQIYSSRLSFHSWGVTQNSVSILCQHPEGTSREYQHIVFSTLKLLILKRMTLAGIKNDENMHFNFMLKFVSKCLTTWHHWHYRFDIASSLICAVTACHCDAVS